MGFSSSVLGWDTTTCEVLLLEPFHTQPMFNY